MSINNWSPEQQSENIDISSIHLTNFIAAGELSAIDDTDYSEIVNQSGDQLTILIKQPIDFWTSTCESLSNDSIISLIRFFTLLEEFDTRYACGKNSPVIKLNSILKQRKYHLDKSVLLWIRQHSSNRFLPNGSIF